VQDIRREANQERQEADRKSRKRFREYDIDELSEGFSSIELDNSRLVDLNIEVLRAEKKLREAKAERELYIIRSIDIKLKRAERKRKRMISGGTHSHDASSTQEWG